MSAADRMAVRVNGEVRSYPRRVALALIANNRAQHAPRPAASAVQVVTAESPALKPGEIELPATKYDGPTLADVGMTQADLLPDVQAKRGPVKFPGNLHDDDAYGDATALPIEAPAVEQPKGNAGRDAWVHYAQAHGVRVTDEMGRNEVRDTVLAKLESDRMSRPAFEGGRPDTPEDEPVTESAVTHADPGEPSA
jgi:hypothetical protein